MKKRWRIKLGSTSQIKWHFNCEYKQNKPRLLTKLKQKYTSTKEDNNPRMVLSFRILEPDSLNIVNQDMDDKGITETNLPFWYIVSDNEFILKASSQNCKFYVGFGKDVGYHITHPFKSCIAFTVLWWYF